MLEMMFVIAVGYKGAVMPTIYSTEDMCNRAKTYMSNYNYVLHDFDKLRCVPVWVEK